METERQAHPRERTGAAEDVSRLWSGAGEQEDRGLGLHRLLEEGVQSWSREERTGGRMELMIYIPTKGRVANQITLRQIPQPLLQNVIVVCPPEELALHQRHGVEVMPMKVSSIGEKRDLIMIHAARNCFKRII